MEAPVGNNTSNSEPTNPWYQTAVMTAVIGGAFSVIILTLFFVNYLHTSLVLPKWEEQLEALKVEIRSKPDDEQLLPRIRKFDLRIRRSRIRRLEFSHRGRYLLFGSVAILLVGVKCASALKKKVPEPGLQGDKLDKQARDASWARWAITGVLAGLGTLALFLVAGPQIDFGAAGPVVTSYPSTEEIAKNWPCFRGPGGLGISAYTNVPTKWDGTTGEAILWKRQVPLPGHNSPVVWDDRVFLSGGDPNGLQVYCFDGSSGELLWTGDVDRAPKPDEEPFEAGEYTGFAAPTVVTDGRRVCAIFATGDVGCFDVDGRRLWTRNLGTPDSAYGYASSLVMYRNLLLIQYDQGVEEDEKSRLIALNTFSGDVAWETKRPVGSSWTTPIVARVGGQDQLITCSVPRVIAYDPTNGAEIWRAECLAGELAPSPIYADGKVLVVEPYTQLVAIRADGRGDVTETHIAWTNEDGGPDICSPVSDGEFIFLLMTDGLLICYKLTDGTMVWEQDLETYFRASPSLVGDRMYLLSEEGVMFIVEAGAEYKELARCELGEKACASPAFADGRIYIRGLMNLYCIANKD
jgi:outer membrane protein assembly factor BamB